VTLAGHFKGDELFGFLELGDYCTIRGEKYLARGLLLLGVCTFCGELYEYES